MDEGQIVEALEQTATNRKARWGIGDPVIPDQQDIFNWRDRLMLFLESLDDDISVGDLRTVLRNYPDDGY